MCDESYAWVPIQYLQYVLSLLWASLVQSRHRIGREIQHPVCLVQFLRKCRQPEAKFACSVWTWPTSKRAVINVVFYSA